MSPGILARNFLQHSSVLGKERYAFGNILLKKKYNPLGIGDPCSCDCMLCILVTSPPIKISINLNVWTEHTT